MVKFLIVIFALSGCGPKKTELRPNPAFSPFVHRIGVLVLKGLSANAQNMVLEDLERFNQVRLVAQSLVKDELQRRNLTINDLFSMHNNLDIVDLSQSLDQLTIVYRQERAIMARSLNFRRKSVTVVDITTILTEGRSWLLYCKSGWIYIDPDPRRHGLEVYLNDRHMGYTPVLINVKDGMYRLLIAKDGDIVLQTQINVPFSSELPLGMGELRKPGQQIDPVEQVRMGRPEENLSEEEAGAVLLTTLSFCLTGVILIVPLLLFGVL